MAQILDLKKQGHKMLKDKHNNTKEITDKTVAQYHQENQMKVSVRFKSSSQKVGGKKTGKYKYWSAVGLIVDKLEEEMKPIEGQLLHEGIMDKLKGIYNRMKDFVVKIFKDIMAYVSKGFKNLISFLDVEPVIDVKSDVKIDV